MLGGRGDENYYGQCRKDSPRVPYNYIGGFYDFCGISGVRATKAWNEVTAAQQKKNLK